MRIKILELKRRMPEEGEQDKYNVRDSDKDFDEKPEGWEDWMDDCVCLVCGLEGVSFLMGIPRMPVCSGCMQDQVKSVPIWKHFAERKAAGLPVSYEILKRVNEEGYTEVCRCGKVITGLTLKQLATNRLQHKQRCNTWEEKKRLREEKNKEKERIREVENNIRKEKEKACEERKRAEEEQKKVREEESRKAKPKYKCMVCGSVEGIAVYNDILLCVACKSKLEK